MRRILVVDDDPHVCLAIRAWLQRYGFRVSIVGGAVNGFAALDRGTFDLMVVDFFMPHMRGFESIRMFHERVPRTALIAMSGYAFANLNSPAPDFLRMALELGALSAQTDHAGRAADRDQRMSFRSPVPRSKRRSAQITSPGHLGGDQAVLIV